MSGSVFGRGGLGVNLAIMFDFESHSHFKCDLGTPSPWGTLLRVSSVLFKHFRFRKRTSNLYFLNIRNHQFQTSTRDYQYEIPDRRNRTVEIGRTVGLYESVVIWKSELINCDFRYL